MSVSKSLHIRPVDGTESLSAVPVWVVKVSCSASLSRVVTFVPFLLACNRGGRRAVMGRG